MSLSNNFPNLKPTLLLDFQNSNRLDGRVTFTRSTTGTYYDGVTVAKAEENLLLYSQDFSQGYWGISAQSSKASTTATAPDGTATALEIAFTAQFGNINIGNTVIPMNGLTNNAVYTLSYWARRDSGSNSLAVYTGGGASLGSLSPTSTWTRYSFTFTWTYGAVALFVIQDRNLSGFTNVQIWGVQLEQCSSVTAYTPTTTSPITNYIPQLLTAPAGVPRFDHTPTTGAALGLMVEPQRTNVLRYSEQFDNATVWKLSSQVLQVTPSQITSPRGTVSAYGLTFLANTGIFNGRALRYDDAVAAGQTVCCSVYAKAGNFSMFTIRLTNGEYGIATFNLSTGQISDGFSYSPVMTPVGNGWYRCSAVFTNSGASAVSFNFGMPYGSYTTTGFGNDFYIWGAQVEIAAFPTSYIQTVAASVTRNADVTAMDGGNFTSWYNGSAGTIYTEVFPLELSAAAGVVINDNTTSNRIRVATASTTDQTTVTYGGTSQAVLDAGTPAANTTMKLAAAYANNDFALSLNGGAVATDTSGTVPLVSQLQIGSETTTTGGLYVRKVAYYNQRLTNAQLQALTS